MSVRRNKSGYTFASECVDKQPAISNMTETQGRVD